jgi:hypothetical protein
MDDVLAFESPVDEVFLQIVLADPELVTIAFDDIVGDLEPPVVNTGTSDDNTCTERERSDRVGLMRAGHNLLLETNHERSPPT